MEGKGLLMMHVMAIAFTTVFWQSVDAQTSAFSAYLSTDVDAVTTDTAITFTGEDVDVGNDFDLTTFTAPVAGTYLFAFSIRTYDAVAHLVINNNNRQRSTSFTDTTHNEANNMASNMAVVNLAAADTVQLVLSSVGTVGLINVGAGDAGFYTSFSGALLAAGGASTAFDAAMVNSNNPDVSSPTQIAFDTENLDLGGGLASDGTFTAPEAGVYLFNIAAKGEMWATHLIYNSLNARSAIQSNDHDHSDNTASNSIILSLAASETVSVNHGTYGQDLLNIHPNIPNAQFTSFKGVRLFADSATNSAFSARRSTNKATETEDSLVTFNAVDANVGGDFSLATSTYTAPSAGTYMFAFASKSSEAILHLKVNNEIKRSIAMAEEEFSDNMAQNFLIINLAASDTVAVYLSEYGSTGIVETGTSQGVYTSFSGFRL